MAAGDSYVEGARVWIPDCAEVWRVAEISRGYKEGDTTLHLRLEDGSALAYPIEFQLPPLCNPDCLSGANDLVALSYVHEPAVLHSLRRRFLEANAIYTYCGIILVSINPYKPLPIYEEEVIYAYSGHEMGDMDPHVFALAEETFKQMVRFGKNQSLIISGESGAGKTVSAKYAMRYFTAIGGCVGDSSMEEKVLASSPIMEAFGNAKTTRNDNSSRFGKYIEIGFSQARVTGATIKTYLLEKSRVTFQAKAERNYHIFYQLCASATLPELQGLGLRGAESFHYTCQGSAAPSSNEAADLDSTRHAFSLLGVPEADQLELFSILAAILHLGNIVVRGRDRRGHGCFVEPADEALGLFCALLGVEASQVMHWLCHCKLVTAGETYLKPLSRQQALNSRDALAKHIYGQVFRWMVSRVNRALRSLEGHRTSIGILDIYGFEMFEFNSFEQFCINYANEKLQQLFNLHVFKLEQEEYVAEEIPWVFIDFCDNQPCIELIEGRLGILDLLNEECKMPQGNNGSWAQKLYQTHLGSSHFQKPKRPTDAFVVCHFAGKVEYQCDGFVEKNRDAVPEELVGLLRASKSALLTELFLEEGGGPVSLQSRRSSGPRMAGRPSRRSLPSSQKSKKSIASQFTASLKQLMELLGSTTPHYVCCIKPNDGKRPFVFDSRRVVEQLRASGLLETIRISALGFPSRWTYREFLERYRALVSREELRGADEKHICSLALERLLQDPSKYQCGKSKVFFRAGQVARLEELRSRRLRAACVLLQRHLRGWLAQRRFARARAAVVCLQRHARGMLARRFARMLRRTRAAVTLQKTLRMVLARRSFLQMRQAVITIQAFARGMFARRFYQQMVWHQKAVVIQAAVRGWLARTRYARLREAVIYLQCCYRRVRARRELRRLRLEAHSVEHYKQLHKGMEIKVIELQCRLDEQVGAGFVGPRAQGKPFVFFLLTASYRSLCSQNRACPCLQSSPGPGAQEKQRLVEQFLVVIAAYAEEVQRLRAEMQQPREDAARDAQVQQLQERLAELERHSATSCLGQEAEELKQCLAEVEAMKLQLGEKDALIQHVLEQSRDLEEQYQRVAHENRGLLQELEEERARYQSLVQEYARLEQAYENVRDEVAFQRELAQKLEKQERTTLKLQEQLRDYAKQIQELTVKREATGPVQELSASAVVLSRSLPVPPLAGPSQAMLAWRMEDEGRIIKAIITDYKPQSSPGAPPDLPAYILFLCFWHADHCCDEPRARSLLDAAISAIKRVMKKHSDDFDTVALWLANTCRLLNCLRQYSQDESYSRENTARQNEHRLQNVDPQSSCRSLGALAVQLYQQLIRTAEKCLKPVIVAAMLESEPIQGLSSFCPPGHRRSSAAPAHTLPELLQQLGSFHAALGHHGLAPSVGHQALRQLLFLVSGTTLNYLLLRKDMCSWSRGIQLRYNISQLEQWLRAEGLQQSGAHEVLEPLVQAAQLLQVKKVTEEDAGALCSLCTVLSPQQVVKILRAYTPTAGLEERISPSFISSVEKRLQAQYGGESSQLLVDTSHLFPVNLPFTPSPLHLDELRIPAALNLAFLIRL
ncbi:unconventional myosin-Vb-like [Alca torda]